MVRVLHVTGSMDRGGAQIFLMNVYRSINRDEIQFDFLLSTDKECVFNDEIRQLGGRIFSVPTRRQGIIKQRNALNEFFSKHTEYRIVHSHVSSLTNMAALKAAKNHGIQIRIVHAHNTCTRGRNGIDMIIHDCLHKWNQRNVKSYATHYFACSLLAAKWLYGEKQYNQGNYHVVKNGIDTNQFRFKKEKRSKIRQALNIQESLIIGHIGRFATQKNHVFLIDIFNEIANRRPDAKLLLVGDGPLRDKIEAKVAGMGLDEQVIFTGVRADTPELLTAMDVFVMPSLHEGLGIVLIEAQASGLPCVASANAVPEEAKVLDCFRFFPLERTAREWAETVLAAAEKDADRSIGTEIVAKAGYDIRDVAAWLEDFYLGVQL